MWGCHCIFCRKLVPLWPPDLLVLQGQSWVLLLQWSLERNGISIELSFYMGAIDLQQLICCWNKFGWTGRIKVWEGLWHLPKICVKELWLFWALGVFHLLLGELGTTLSETAAWGAKTSQFVPFSAVQMFFSLFTLCAQRKKGFW